MHKVIILLAFTASACAQSSLLRLPAAPPAVAIAMTGATTADQPGGDQTGSQPASQFSSPTFDPEQARGSTYISVDSWIYPAMLRLYSLGYVPTAFLGLRPWTRASVLAMLAYSQDAIMEAGSSDPEAETTFDRVYRELHQDEERAPSDFEVAPDSLYTRVRGVHGSILNDSLHLGQTFINDFGRPIQSGLDNSTGFSMRSERGRFTLFVRGEYQRAPSATGYSPAVASTLAAIDTTPDVPQSTIPEGVIPQVQDFRLLDANLSFNLLKHEISFGKSDAWLGPGVGGAMAWSDNAENIYSFRINRVEPLWIPGLSRLIGLARYDFFVGSLKGHAYPNDPWIHSEKFSFKPHPNVEFGFQRSVIWGGEGHVPITIHTFLRSFFSVAGVQPDVKFSRADPGARFSEFDFTWRLPHLTHWLTLYFDSTVHDNVFAISNPGRSGYRPGLYVARFPKFNRVDLRVEGVTTDPSVAGYPDGQFLYWEVVQQQGYTNKGRQIGDWIGRQGKGGQAWLTYHKDGNQSFQMFYRNAKSDSAFIPGGTTLHDFGVAAVLRPRQQFEINAQIQEELWKAPLIATGQQRNFSATVQFTFYPRITLPRRPVH